MITHSAYGRSTLKLFRKVANDFDFLVRDIDRQPVVLPGTLVFHVWDESGTTLLTAPLTVVNEQRGHYRLRVTSEMTAPVRTGIYVWSVTNDFSAVTKLLYTNQDYGSRGLIEVAEGLPTLIADPYIIAAADMTPLGGDLISSPMPGASGENNLTGNHTAVVALDAYTGTLTIRGTLDDQPSNDQSGWAVVDTIDFTETSGARVVNFQGNYTYVRFELTRNPGFTKLTYRN